ncbi:MAG TPA: hypothetical protein V6C88_03400 [Chroococcidiopsis sp.]
MVATVITINTIIAILCLAAAVWVWRLRRVLGKVADALTLYERNTHRVLDGAPAYILSGQRSTSHLRQQIQQLDRQLATVRRVTEILSLIRLLWLRQNPLARRSPKPYIRVSSKGV